MNVEVHKGFGCDVCRQLPILGTRYSCTNCSPSYDLCSSCKHEGIHHSEHKMAKVSAGSAESLPTNLGIDNKRSDYHFGFGCNICDKSIYGSRYHCTRCFDFDLCSSCMQKGQHEKHRANILKFETPMDTLIMFLRGKMPEAEGSHFMTKYQENVTTPKYWTHFHSKKSLKDWNSQGIRRQCDIFKKVSLKPSSEEFSEIKNVVVNTWRSDLFLQGRDAKGLESLGYTKLKVESIERLENPELFERYAQERARLFNKAAKIGSFKKIEEIGHAKKGPIATADLVTKRELYTEINEHYLFHGTTQECIDLIATQGLDCRLAGEAMFGPGVYCAESSTKSDQYADQRKNRTKDGIKIMLLNRVCLGEIYIEQKNKAVQWKRPPCKRCLKDKCTDSRHNIGNAGFYDSVVNDSELIFREFIVYSKERCYPEYIIHYKRI